MVDATKPSGKEINDRDLIMDEEKDEKITSDDDAMVLSKFIRSCKLGSIARGVKTC